MSGKNRWLWAFQNKAATYLAFDKSRGHDVVNRSFSPEARRGTVRVTDRWPAYFMGDVGMEDHQVCIAHLLRNLTYTAQAFPDDASSGGHKDQGLLSGSDAVGHNVKQGAAVFPLVDLIHQGA